MITTTTELDPAIAHVTNPSGSTTMRALVYHGPGEYAWEDKPCPTIREPGDANRANCSPASSSTHRFAMIDILKAYETFGNAAKEGALKVVLTNGGPR
ncbi:MAG: hypothetical protein WB566_11440 [Terriglobales bacterium]